MAKRRRKEEPYAQKIIPWIIFAIVMYTAADFYLQLKTGIEISPTLTTCYFGFWTAEIINLAAIKTSKEKTKRTVQDSASDTTFG